MQRQTLMDSIAGTLSLACLAHCLLLPILLVALPALSALLDIPESFHIIVLAMAIPVSALALMSGHRRHGHASAILIGSAGLSVMGWGAVMTADHDMETALTVIGSLKVAAAHLLNWRLSWRTSS